MKIVTIFQLFQVQIGFLLTPSSSLTAKRVTKKHKLTSRLKSPKVRLPNTHYVCCTKHILNVFQAQLQKSAGAIQHSHERTSWFLHKTGGFIIL